MITYTTTVNWIVGQIHRMDSLFEAHFSPLAASGKPLGRCGKCGRFMKFMPMRPTRLYCPTCEDILNLPQNGAIKVGMCKQYHCIVRSTGCASVLSLAILHGTSCTGYNAVQQVQS